MIDTKENMMEDESNSFVIKVVGYPWATTEKEILEFFDKCKVTNGKDGVHMIKSYGNSRNVAYVEMETDKDIEEALEKDREYLGARYLEVYKTNRSEMELVLKNPNSYADKSLMEGCVKLKGLPYDCSVEDVAEFFTGLKIVPNGIVIPKRGQSGRNIGIAYVQFADNEEAEKALAKNGEYIGLRYINIIRAPSRFLKRRDSTEMDNYLNKRPSSSTQQRGNTSRQLEQPSNGRGGGGGGEDRETPRILGRNIRSSTLMATKFQRFRFNTFRLGAIFPVAVCAFCSDTSSVPISEPSATSGVNEIAGLAAVRNFCEVKCENLKRFVSNVIWG